MTAAEPWFRALRQRKNQDFDGEAHLTNEELVALLDIAEAAHTVADRFTAEAEDWNDGVYALWRKDDLIVALSNLRVAVGRASNRQEGEA